jgi:hypothetical protein
MVNCCYFGIHVTGGMMEKKSWVSRGLFHCPTQTFGYTPTSIDACNWSISSCPFSCLVHFNPTRHLSTMEVYAPL